MTSDVHGHPVAKPSRANAYRWSGGWSAWLKIRGLKLSISFTNRAHRAREAQHKRLWGVED